MLVFLSHSGSDAWVARQIEGHSRSAGADVFLDEANIDIGELFPEVIRDYLEKADELLVLFTPWSLQRPWVWVEVGVAFYRRIPIVAVLYGLSADELREKSEVPAFMLERNVVQINDIDRYFRELRGREETRATQMTEKKREPKVFVSYSAPDAEWATSFARDLAQEGFDVRPGDWSAGSRTGHGAGWTPASGENWAQAMAEDLRDSDVIILVLSAGGLDSPWVLFELGVAMAGAKAVVPIVSDGVDALTLPVPLQSVVFVRKESPEATAARVASGLLKAS